MSYFFLSLTLRVIREFLLCTRLLVGVTAVTGTALATSFLSLLLSFSSILPERGFTLPNGRKAREFSHTSYAIASDERRRGHFIKYYYIYIYTINFKFVISTTLVTCIAYDVRRTPYV